MTIVTLGSVRGAPGVTTTSLLVAGAVEGAVLVDADLAGGALAVRYDLGREPGLTTLAAARSDDPQEWRSHAQDAGGVAVLVGPDDPDTSEALWQGTGHRLLAHLRQVDASLVVADAGRLEPGYPLLAASDLVVVLVRPIAEHLVTLSHRLPALRRARARHVAVILVGYGPYSSDEIRTSLEVDVVGELPFDERAATMLIEGGRSRASLARTRLARAATGLGAAIARLASDQPDPAGVAP